MSPTDRATKESSENTTKTSCRCTRVEPTQRVSVQHAHKIYFIMNNDDAKHTCIHMYYNNMLVQI